MDERLQNLLNGVQKTAADFSASASDAAYAVGARASQLISVGKLNVRLADLKAQVAAELRQVGEMVYATHTGAPTDSEDLLAKLQVIDELNSQIAGLSAELASARGDRVCFRCGAVAEPADVFCRQCGEKL